MGTLAVQEPHQQVAEGAPSGPRERLRTRGKVDVDTRPPNFSTKVAKLDKEREEQTEVITNYFRVLQCADWAVFRYSVEFNCEVDLSKRTAEKKRMIEQHKVKLPNYIYDGSNLYTMNRLADDLLKLTSEFGRADIGRPKVVAQVELKLNGQVQGPQERNHLINLIKNEFMSGVDLIQIRYDFFDVKKTVRIPNFKLEVLPGICCKARDLDGGLMLQVDLVSKIIRTDSVYDVMKNLPPRDLKRKLVGLTVVAPYCKFACYIIDDIVDDTPRTRTFEERGTKKEINLMQYYEKTYGIKIKDPNQKLLLSRPQARDVRGGRNFPIFLVPELVNIAGLSDEQRADHRLNMELHKYTRKAPVARIQEIKGFLDMLMKNPKAAEVFKKWGMGIEKEPLRIKSRMIKPLAVHLRERNGGQMKLVKKTTSDWTSFLRNGILGSDKGDVAPRITIQKVAIFYSPDVQRREVEMFIQSYVDICGRMGILINAPTVNAVDGRGSRSWSQAFSNVSRNDFDFVFSLIPDRNNEDEYFAVKEMLLVKKGILNQVVRTRNVVDRRKGGPNPSILTKIAVQMASKLSHRPWAVENPLKQAFGKPWMAIGYDTFHKKRSSNMVGKSFGAITFSYDLEMTKYFCQVFENAAGTEMANSLYRPIKAGINNFKSQNRRLPELILYYRDGVGEYQVEDMLNYELGQIQKALSDAVEELGGSKPKVVVILVNKRISTKFFMENPPKEQTRFTNPPSGTLIDMVVTRPEAYDFYLVSQTVTQGTVNPTAYSVILDEAELGASVMQRVTYILCHLYQNWPGTIRVPAPCMYAHKLAYFMGECLKDRHYAEQLNNSPLNCYHYFI